MNDENIIGKGKPFRAGEEQSKIARAGGVASGAARRKKRAAKQAYASVLASLPELNKLTIQNLKSMGIDPDSEDVDIQMIIAMAIAQKAMRGNVSAASFMMEMTGEDAYSKIQRERLNLEKRRLELERKRLEMEEKRAAGGFEEEIPDDGFIEALNAAGTEVWSDGSDEPADLDPDPERDAEAEE